MLGVGGRGFREDFQGDFAAQESEGNSPEDLGSMRLIKVGECGIRKVMIKNVTFQVRIRLSPHFFILQFLQSSLNSKPALMGR